MLVSKSAMQGSIGSGQIGYDRINNRIKGFSEFKLREERDVRRLTEKLKDARERNPQADRTTVRAMVSKRIIEDLRLHPNGLGRVEAVVDIDNVDQNYVLAYFGENLPHRMSPQEIREQEATTIRDIQKIQPTNREAALKRLEAGEDGKYEIRLMENLDENTLDQLVDLYRATFSDYTFDLNQESVRGMLEGNNRMFVTFSPKGDVAGAMVAEHASIQIENTTLELYELSDYATSREHRGKGIMTAMQIEAINLLRQMEGGQQFIIYSENRAPWTPVNISSHKTGIMDYAGTLDKHCNINSDRDILETGNYENLNVFVANGWHGYGQY
jgi:RimJ/RimL family protein N-acetyltransferase